MSPKSAQTARPSRQNDDEFEKIRRLSNYGLINRAKLPILKIAMKRLKAAGGDVAKIGPAYRRALQDYNTSLQTAALKSPASMAVLRRNLMNGFEITDKEQVSESVLEESYMPPQMLVLRRQGIRIFPDGRRVALYSNDKLGLVFTIPYLSTGEMGQTVANVTSEEVEHVEENIEHIKNIVKDKQAKKLKFRDGTSLNVDATTAKAIHLIHGSLNDQNKAKVADMLSHSKGQFMKVADFALKNTAFK